jgi:pimeloyl-ACP methyl ester carboxylesterase
LRPKEPLPINYFPISKEIHMRRWLKRIGIGFGLLLIALIVAGAGYEQIMRLRAARTFPPLGRMLDVGGRRMQIDCRGVGSPTVVFEAGLDFGGAMSWLAVHDPVAKITRACTYSRAGVMWSDPAPGRFDPERAMRDLHTLLTNAGERPPFVMVSHSFGGPLSMIFIGLYPKEVAGLVFVDISHPDMLARQRTALGQAPPAPSSATNIASMLTWTGLPRLLVTINASDIIDDPAARHAELAYVNRSLPAAIAESQGLALTLAAAAHYRDLGDRPLVVLTSTKPLSEETLKSAGLTEAQGKRLYAATLAMEDEEATWSRRSRHEPVLASHYIQVDRPDVVIEAVRDVVTQLKDR